MDASTASGRDLRAALIRAARQILDEPDTSFDLRKVAERVGKSRTAPYLVFGRTEDGGGLAALRLAVAESGLADLLIEIKQALADAEDPEEALRSVGTLYISFAQRHPRLFRLMFGPEVAGALRSAGSPQPSREAQDVLRARADLEELLRWVIVACQSVGAMGPGDPYPLVMGSWAAFHGATMLLLDGQLQLAGVAKGPDEAAELAARLVLEKPGVVVARAATALDEAQAKREDEPTPRLAGEETPPLPAEAPDGHEELPALDPVREIVARTPALRRARRSLGLLEGSRVLWIDDQPGLSAAEQRSLEALGVRVVRASDTVPALELLSARGPRPGSRFDLIISDIARPDSRTGGTDALPLLRQLAPNTPVIFYLGKSDPHPDQPPGGSFGMTADPAELLHLVIDVFERRRG